MEEKEVQKQLEGIAKEFDKIQENLASIETWCDGLETPLLEKKKMKKKERQEYLAKKAKEMFPTLVLKIENISEGLEGLGFLLREKYKRLDELQENLEDYGNLREDIRREIDSLSLD